MREATDIADRGIMRAMHAAKPGLYEYQLQAESEYEFKRDGAYGPAYFALVATGKNTWYTHYHYNTAQYEGDPNDEPISTTQHRTSQYGGAQIALNLVNTQHAATASLYAFGQADHEFVNLIANDGSAPPLFQNQRPTGHLEAGFSKDQ